MLGYLIYDPHTCKNILIAFITHGCLPGFLFTIYEEVLLPQKMSSLMV